MHLAVLFSGFMKWIKMSLYFAIIDFKKRGNSVVIFERK
ncbi:hypothetical protein swp_3389 [Shewanella piezotolerans WP3]|uniref:Uncharacterized protein n=1 Tax=Shewanella piezotolerans (strain WP3 / JCM 13877) TaxID=225849 RepID=B8CRT2_SHEPW|nr:hypothetical protein swp_3389 [Shewanella piezotolerans WP3]